MFFLGLAGSFMPYLLLFGALFVLTMGVNFRAEKDLLTSEEKTIEYQTPDNEDLKSETNCYFFDIEKIKKADHHDTNYSILKRVDDFLVYKPRGKTQLPLVIENYSFDIHHEYFGLSPPVLIS